MSRDIFGLTPQGFSRKIEAEKIKIDNIKGIFVEVFNQIKYTAEEDGWQRLVIFSENSEFFNDLPYTLRSMIFYYLRRHKNIISKLSDREKKHITDSMKPYLLKFVPENEKQALGMNAIFFRNVPKNIQEYIFANLRSNKVESFIDVLSVLEFLCGKKETSWIEMSIFNISSFSGVPIENVRFALNTLLKLKLIVLVYVPCEQRKGRKKLNLKVTFSADEHNGALAGENIAAETILSDENIIIENFNFTVAEYFYGLLDDDKNLNNSVKRNLVPQQDEPTLNFCYENKLRSKPETSKQIPLIEDDQPKNQNLVPQQPINVIVPEIKGLNETLDDIKRCISSFSSIAEKMYESTSQKNELLDSFVQTSAQKKQEYDELYNQMVIMKKLLNKQERDKHQFVKSIQDSLNMMMGQIITATDYFARIPRHQMDEYKIQKFKADVIKIAVQTAEEIRKFSYTPEKKNEVVA